MAQLPVYVSVPDELPSFVLWPAGLSASVNGQPTDVGSITPIIPDNGGFAVVAKVVFYTTNISSMSIKMGYCTATFDVSADGYGLAEFFGTQPGFASWKVNGSMLPQSSTNESAMLLAFEDNSNTLCDLTVTPYFTGSGSVSISAAAIKQLI